MTANKKKVREESRRQEAKKKVSRKKKKHEKEKRAACVSKRPKSREETPKEGSDSARRYRTATICDRAAQNASTFVTFPVQNSPRQIIRQKLNAGGFPAFFQILESRPQVWLAETPRRYHQALEFVIDDFAKKCTVSPVDSKAKKYGL